jgi:hypothetical protein
MRVIQVLKIPAVSEKKVAESWNWNTCMLLKWIGANVKYQANSYTYDITRIQNARICDWFCSASDVAVNVKQIQIFSIQYYSHPRLRGRFVFLFIICFCMLLLFFFF